MLMINEIVKAAHGEILYGKYDKEITSIVTDSRDACEGSLFAAIAGERVDGHDYIGNAAQNGCKVVLCEHEIVFVDGITVIMVENTVKALGDIARYYMTKQNVRRIAVTGSVGKTTTKDIIYSVLSKDEKTLKTIGNFNNELGLPLTAFRVTDDVKYGVFEMGMSEFGEIAYLSSIIHPEAAVITNIGHSHIENLGSREGILKAKCEIADFMNENGVLILNGDDPLLYGIKDKMKQKLIYFGINNPECDYVAEVKKVDEKSTVFGLNGAEYTLPIPGIHNLYNALPAIIIGEYYGISPDKIKAGIEAFELTGMRMEFKEANGYTLLVDCYNSSPDSIKAGIGVLKNMKSARRKIAVLGSIRELGDLRDELLYSVGRSIAESKSLDMLITVGEDALAINKGAKDSGFHNHLNLGGNKEAAEYLKSVLKEGDAVLIKASRYYKFEEIADALCE